MIKKFFIILSIAVSVVTTISITDSAYAVDCVKTPTAAGCPCAINPDSSVCQELNKEAGTGTFDVTLKNVINTLLFAIAIIAVIMIIVSAIRFTTSHGNPDIITKARLTIVYSVTGLVVAILAFAIVNYVVKQLQ